MVWARLDDGFADHPKVEGLSDGAFRLHVSGICYAARVLTDGLVPGPRVPRLVPRFKAAHLSELDGAQMWHPAGHDCDVCPQPPAGDWWIHDFLDCNRSKDRIETEREASAERQRRARESRRDIQRDSRRSNGVSHTVPSRPVLSNPSSSPSATASVVEFEEWWARYPRKVGKGSAQRAYRSARKTATVVVLIAGLDRSVAHWRKQGTEPGFIPHPATWLNGRRWEDNYTANGVPEPIEVAPW